MAQILFASNNPTHWGSMAYEGASYFDATRVPYSIEWASGGIGSPDFKVNTGTITWLRMYFAGGVQGSAIGASEEDAFHIRDQQERSLLRLRSYGGNTSGYYTFYNADGASNNTGSIGSVNTARWYDFKFEITPFLISVEVYHNGVLFTTNSFGSNPAVVTHLKRIEFPDPNNIANVSEVIVSDGDTRLARLNMVRPVSAGNYSDWQGNLTTLTDNNLNTGLTTVSANQRSSLIMESYTNTEIISNVVVSSQHLRGQNSPSKIRHFLRASSIDYDNASTFDVDFGPTVSQSDYPNNPATSLPWDFTNLGTTEFGFKSET